MFSRALIALPLVAGLAGPAWGEEARPVPDIPPRPHFRDAPPRPYLGPLENNNSTTEKPKFETQSHTLITAEWELSEKSIDDILNEGGHVVSYSSGMMSDEFIIETTVANKRAIYKCSMNALSESCRLHKSKKVQVTLPSPPIAPVSPPSGR